MRLGIFGGTFDPPHVGHLRLATAALEQLSLDRVLWVLTADPPHKQRNAISPVEDRLAMVAAAIAGQGAFEISRVEIDRPGPHWSADTVRLVREQHPGAELYYLMGGDSLADLPTWGRPQAFLAATQLGVLRRPGDEVDLAALEAVLPGVSERVRYIDVPPMDVASQDIRERVREGLPLEGLVPPAVEAIIDARGLYGG
jgi:nicotinate-nucleotide adenylyltransferase